MSRAPLGDDIIVALAQLVDDAGKTREPSHSQLEFEINRSGLKTADPSQNGRTVGKAKRVREVLHWAYEQDTEAGEKFAYRLVSVVRGHGGFREESPNFIGRHVIENLSSAFQLAGYTLGSDGTLSPVVLDSLSGVELTTALKSYVQRAKRGVADAALVTGTGKDLLEATAKHVLVEKWGRCPESNFPELLGQAFAALNFETNAFPLRPGTSPQKKLERALYEAACAVNGLRNKEGTGHGRPWLSNVSDPEARCAVEIMGCIAERMLSAL